MVTDASQYEQCRTELILSASRNSLELVQPVKCAPRTQNNRSRMTAQHKSEAYNYNKEEEDNMYSEVSHNQITIMIFIARGGIAVNL